MAIFKFLSRICTFYPMNLTYASLLHTWTYLSILFLCHKCCEWWWTSCHKICLLFFWWNVLTWQISSLPALVLWLRCKLVWPFRYTLEQKVSYLRNVKMISAIQRLYYRAVLCVIKCTGFQIVFSALGVVFCGRQFANHLWFLGDLYIILLKPCIYWCFLVVHPYCIM